VREIKPLTSLRGLAAMAVVMQHFSATAQRICPTTIPSLVPHGYVAVDLFFVLSGFIMSYTYAAGFLEHGLASFPDFLARRVARIVPLNIVVLATLMLCGGLSVLFSGYNIFFRSDNIPVDFFLNVLMLQGLGVGDNLNGPSWSISTEFAAYFMFPLFVGLVFLRLRTSLAVVAGSVMALGWLALLHPRLGLDTGPAGQAVTRCFTEFIMGMAAYRLYSTERAARWFGTDRVAFGLAIACCAALVLRVDLPAALLFPFLIVSLACNRGRMEQLMSMRVPYFLGVISYSLYLIHDAFRPLELAAVRFIHPMPLGPVTALSFAMLGSLSVIPFAWVAYGTVERPGRRIVRWALVRGEIDRALPIPSLRPGTE
jgi:peptidoglycan/LPS O-acetylase OafA/YrhL